MLKNGVASPLAIGTIPKIAAIPIKINNTMVITFTDANQNSDSAKNFTVNAFNKNITMAKIPLHIHTLIDGNQRCINSPAAVNSDPSATVQVNQYSHATVYPVLGPIYLAA
ncbi:hypothetical protein D3C77_457390 [compost metagenome]